jgi:ribosomal protein L30E
MKVRCAFTSCKNNRKRKTGYFCQLREIHIYKYSLNGEDFKMACQQEKIKKGYTE